MEELIDLFIMTVLLIINVLVAKRKYKYCNFNWFATGWLSMCIFYTIKDLFIN
jgi:hypothetical protein